MNICLFFEGTGHGVSLGGYDLSLYRAYEYGEATPHLVLLAFLQRVTGCINRDVEFNGKMLH